MITFVLLLGLLTSTGDKTLVSIGGLPSMEVCHVAQKKFYIGLMVEDQDQHDAKIVSSVCLLQKVT